MAPDGSKLDAGVNPRDAPELAAKRAEEVAMVREMIALWCRGHHTGAAERGERVLDVERLASPRHHTGAAERGERGGPDVRVRLGRHEVRLCPACAELAAYATARVGRCPHMGTKTFCSACPTHCYRPEMRERIREVMRWSGPRMLRYRPVPALRHAWVSMQGVIAAKRGRRG